MGGQESKPGYRVIQVIPDSPAHGKGFVEFLDFIVSINGTDILESSLPFQELIKSNIDCPVTLGVFSVLTMELREVCVTPQVWKGEGLIGINLRYEDAMQVSNNILRITKVFPDSSASRAGLIEGEYIVGCKEAKIKDSEDILGILDKLKKITLAVFNNVDLAVHYLELQADDGSIGIEVASGVMHRIVANN
jgi:C-terminal processing protease CtpA/Prc